MSKSVMLEKAVDFAVETVNLCKNIKSNNNEFVLTHQLTKSSTSVGANIYESKYAQSKADFISKMKIALKECYESEYWFELLLKTDYISENDYNRLMQQCGAIRRMLISSVRTVEKNIENEKNG